MKYYFQEVYNLRMTELNGVELQLIDDAPVLVV